MLLAGYICSCRQAKRVQQGTVGCYIVALVTVQFWREIG